MLEAGGFEAVEVTEAGLREGVFFESLPRPRRPAAVRLRAGGERPQPGAAVPLRPAARRARRGALAPDARRAGGGGRCTPADPEERELLWAAALLHDIGVTVDYDDHHKHSRYLILNAGLPGFSPREVALIAQMARYHRKGSPGFGELAPLMRKGDAEMLERCSALLRVAEQLERSRDQVVRDARVDVQPGTATPSTWRWRPTSDVSVARWAAARQVDLFERAFGRGLTVA